jgi:hypothetical protein
MRKISNGETINNHCDLIKTAGSFDEHQAYGKL